MSFIFSITANLIGLYSVLCLIRIVISWFPQLQDNVVARFLANICDPFFAIFNFSFSQVGALNLSSIFALFFLYLVQNIFQSLAIAQNFNAFTIFTIIINLALSLINAILTIILVIVGLRLILELTRNKNTYTEAIDRFLAPLYNIAQSITSARDRTSYLVFLTVVILIFKIVISFISFKL
ncbi:MAG: YggT family protein [Treponemataceae bacterium]